LTPAPPPLPKLIVDPSVPLNVRVLFKVTVFKLATVTVALTVEVIVKPLILVAVAAPRLGDVSVGDVKVLFVNI
jgi:hypothetical protein